MKYVNFLLGLMAITFSSWSIAGGTVEAYVELSPTGSFVVKSDKISGSIKKNNGVLSAESLSVKVKNLSTDMELRDDHMRKKISDEKSKAIEVVEAKGSDGKGEASLVIKGVKKPIKFSYVEKGNKVELEFFISLKEFNIESISYMGIGVEDKVKIKANLDL